MSDYLICECELDSDKLVHVFNECDLPNVQEQFTKQGYFIKETFAGKDGDYFFVIRRLEER